MLAIAGAADVFTVVFRGTIVQQTTPEEFRGRVIAADYVVGASGGQLGDLEAGALGSLTSPAISALSGGLITVAGGPSSPSRCPPSPVTGPALARLPDQRGVMPGCPRSLIRPCCTVLREDPGSREYLVHPSALDPPRSPDLPR